jgi:hypothetical protein
MKRNSEFIPFKELLERWDVDKTDILNIVRREKFTCLIENYIGLEVDERTKQLLMHELKLKRFDEYYCLRSEIEGYEKKHPEFKQQDTPYVSYNDEEPYLNPSNKECYSKELAISIQVWMQLFKSGLPPKSPRYTLLEQIKAALKEKGIASDRAIDRLASVINPDKNKRGGGAHTKIKATSKRTVKK